MLPSKVHHYKSEKAGPIVTIMGGMHGDETNGVEAIQFLVDFFEANPIAKGELYLIVANPEAVKLKRRGVEHDMNRMFLDELNPEFQGSYEHQRVEELKPILEKTDYFLDIHSASNPSKSFSIALIKTPEHTELMNILPVEFPSYGWGNKIAGTAMAWVDASGGVGVAIEAGWEEDPKTTQISIDCAKAFLDKLEIFEFGDFKKPQFKKYVQILERVMVRDSKTFDYSKNFANFDSIQANQLLATDSQGEYRAIDQDDLIPLTIDR